MSSCWQTNIKVKKAFSESIFFNPVIEIPAIPTDQCLSITDHRLVR